MVQVPYEMFFTGCWEAVGWFYRDGTRWRRWHGYALGAWLWEFRIGAPLTEWTGGRWKEVPFGYDATGRTMWIDRSDYEPDGFLNSCFEDNFRLLKLDDCRAWLGNADTVDDEGRITAALLWLRRSPDECARMTGRTP